MCPVNPAILLVALAGGSGCQPTARTYPEAEAALTKISFKVLGMMKAKSGAT